MKVQCDVCAAEAASVLCCADEAALCDACDRRVHRANKLAGKHRRFSLVPSSSSSSLSSSFSPQFQPPPLCDICQKKRGLLFCQEDRAILCCDCDVAIHAASDLTMRHSRFLLTGVRISSAPLDESKSNKLSTAEDVRSHSKVSREVTLAASASASASASAAAAAAEEEAVCSSSSNSSSISEYLIKTIPGWQVEEFLTDDAATAAAAATAASVTANRSYQGVENQYCNVGEGFLPTWIPQEQFFYEGVGAKAEAEAAEMMVPQIYNDWRGGEGGGGGGGGGNKRSRNCLSYW